MSAGSRRSPRRGAPGFADDEPTHDDGEEQQPKIPRLLAELNPDLPDDLVACVEAERKANTAATGLIAVAATLLYYQRPRDT